METSGTSHTPRFTLLHGVIAGILLVGAYVIISPVFRSARPAAGKVSCMSNMKLLAAAQLLYAGDHDEAIPRHFTFDGAQAQKQLTSTILPYIKQSETFLCSESVRRKADPSNAKQEIDYEHFPLILKLVGKDNLIRLDKVSIPDKTPWMHDAVLKMSAVSDGQEIETNHKEHPNAFSVMFFDCHVNYVPTRQSIGRDAMSTDGVWLK